jgi:flagellar assembly protein FliH
MKIILTADELGSHEVNKYHFRTINVSQGVAAGKEEHIVKSSVPQSQAPQMREESKAEAPEPKSEEVNSALQELQQQNESFSESLLKKIDELSTSLVKMEMRLEKQQEEFAARLEEERTQAHEAGIEAGKLAMRESIAQELDAQKRQIIDSIQKMQHTAESFEKVSQNIEKELVDAAIDIAKEVIASEIAGDSSKVATNLAKALIEDVKGAMKIKVKANPEDCDYLKENVGTNGVLEVVPDSAISKGGIVIESDAGNVDGTVMTRYQAIKRNILEH